MGSAFNRIGVGGPFIVKELKAAGDFKFLAAPIWVTLAVQKRRKVGLRIKTKTQFIKPIRATAVVIVIHKKPLTVVSLAEFYRKKSVAKTRVTKVFGHVTAKPKLYPILVVGFAAKAKVRKRVITGKISLGKPKGKSTKPVKVKGPVVLSFATKEKIRKKRIFGSIELKGIFGKPTTKPGIHPVVVIDFAAQEKIKKKKIFNRSSLGKPAKTVAIVIAVLPKPLKVLLQKIPKKPKTTSKLGKIFGKPTKAPLAQKLKVISQPGNIKLLRKRHKAVTVLRKVYGSSDVFIWTEFGSPFLFTAANWTAPNVFFEVYFRAIVGTIFARVLDTTTGLPVVGSDLNTALNIFQRLRSPEIFLEDGHVYKLQFGKFTSDSAEAFSGELIIM